MTLPRIPLLLYGDGPRLASGLARIARDLALRLVAREEELGVRVAQVGVDYMGGWQWQTWDFAGFKHDAQDQGRATLEAAIADLTQECGIRPIVFLITDPARCYEILRPAPQSPDASGQIALAQLPATFWGYYPIDAENLQGAVGGPAWAATLWTDRLLGYGRYGAKVLKATREQIQHGAERIEPRSQGPISYLPHGIEPTFRPGIALEQADPEWADWARSTDPLALRIGCVATNQPRKDLGLLFQTLGRLKQQGELIAAWLHTDLLTKAWDVGELVRTCGLERHEVAVSIHPLTDLQLAARYGWSHLTVAPGLGEGFGYPIVESLACGTPVVHGDYAGGVELIPERSWILSPEMWRLESVYAVKRPVHDPRYWAETIARIAAVEGKGESRAYCQSAVAHLQWDALWPRWESWIRAGLTEHRQREETRIKSSEGQVTP